MSVGARARCNREVCVCVCVCVSSGWTAAISTTLELMRVYNSVRVCNVVSRIVAACSERDKFRLCIFEWHFSSTMIANVCRCCIIHGARESACVSARYWIICRLYNGTGNRKDGERQKMVPWSAVCERNTQIRITKTMTRWRWPLTTTTTTTFRLVKLNDQTTINYSTFRPYKCNTQHTVLHQYETLNRTQWKRICLCLRYGTYNMHCMQL